MDFFSYFFKDFLVQPNSFEWEFIYAMSQNGNADALNGNFCITVNFNQKKCGIKGGEQFFQYSIGKVDLTLDY